MRRKGAINNESPVRLMETLATCHLESICFNNKAASASNISTFCDTTTNLEEEEDDDGEEEEEEEEDEEEYHSEGILTYFDARGRKTNDESHVSREIELRLD